MFAGGLAAKQSFTDRDIVHFLTNVECVPRLSLKIPSSNVHAVLLRASRKAATIAERDCRADQCDLFCHAFLKCAVSSMHALHISRKLMHAMPCRCLEGQFDTWGTFGHGFNNNLTLGGPTPIGARKANLSDAVLPYMQEVALNEQVSLNPIKEPFASAQLALDFLVDIKALQDCHLAGF